MENSELVRYWLGRYRPGGNLLASAELILSFGRINHAGTVAHMERVALLARRAAEIINSDAKAAFLAALLHDLGKFVLPADLFAEQSNPPANRHLSPEEFERIKTHARNGFKILKGKHEFIALCAGLHHNVTSCGYGIADDDWPREWPHALRQKVMTVATFVAICDFLDAALTRNGSNLVNWEMIKVALEHKFADQKKMVAAAIQSATEQKTLYA